MTREQVKALNNLIETCIMNGGDAGGPYVSCQKECVNVVQRLTDLRSSVNR